MQGKKDVYSEKIHFHLSNIYYYQWFVNKLEFSIVAFKAEKLKMCRIMAKLQWT